MWDSVSVPCSTDGGPGAAETGRAQLSGLAAPRDGKKLSCMPLSPGVNVRSCL